MLTSREVRALGLTIVHDPNDETVAHAILRGPMTMDACQQLAERTRVIIAPDMVNGSRRVKPQ